jgi:hypothetical protein
MGGFTSIVLASGLVAGTAVAQTPTRSCVRIEVSSPSGSAPSAPGPARPTVPLVATPSFSVTRILDLDFTVLFPPGLQGEHVVELRVFTPDAQLYRSLTTPFARGAQPNAVRQVDGYARPVTQQQLRRVSRSRRLFAAVSTTLPVGGTDIVSSGLYGRWRVEAYLDGAEQRCGAAASFNLNP